jgi:selenocysteine lyase/cysteine desulfurase
MYKTEAFYELEKGVHSALETYSNVHRGSGHNSLVTTHLFEKARMIVLDYLGLKKGKQFVIFCTRRSLEALQLRIKTKDYTIISSEDIGLPLGVWAIIINKKSLPGGAPSIAGGGTARLMSPDWVVWDNAPDRFEAGTPAIINIIAFARALCLIKKYGNEIFMDPVSETLTAREILYHDELDKYSGKELLDELRKTIIGSGVKVPTANGLKPYINFDYGASTPTFTPVWNAVRNTWRQPRQIQEEIINEVRSVCSDALGAPLSDYDLIFTSNTTDAINLAADSLKPVKKDDSEPVVLTTMLEHSSNDLPWRLASSTVIRLGIDEEGFVDHDEMEKYLREYNQDKLHGKKKIKIVAISGASNVLGVYNHLKEIAAIVHKYGALLMVDAAQMAAHRKIDMSLCNIDYLAFSAHKVYAPFGTGVLLAKKGLLNLTPSELKKINASGEENSIGIAALGKIIILLQRIGMDLIMDEEKALTRHALDSLSLIPEVTLYGISDPESASFDYKGGVIVFSLKDFMSNKVAEELAIQGGIGIRFGCHCAHILIKHLLGVGPGLQKFQKMIVTLFPGLRLPGLARISFGIGSTIEEVDELADVLKTMAEKNRKSSQKETKILINDFVREAEVRVYS